MVKIKHPNKTAYVLCNVLFIRNTLGVFGVKIWVVFEEY